MFYWTGKHLTDILGPGAGYDQGPSARLLQHPVAVDLPVERLPVFLPSVPERFLNDIFIPKYFLLADNLTVIEFYHFNLARIVDINLMKATDQHQTILISYNLNIF